MKYHFYMIFRIVSLNNLNLRPLIFFGTKQIKFFFWGQICYTYMFALDTCYKCIRDKLCEIICKVPCCYYCYTDVCWCMPAHCNWLFLMNNQIFHHSMKNTQYLLFCRTRAFFKISSQVFFDEFLQRHQWAGRVFRDFRVFLCGGILVNICDFGFCQNHRFSLVSIVHRKAHCVRQWKTVSLWQDTGSCNI